MKGIERIKILASEIKDEALLQIVNYLLTREDMDDKYLNEEKSLKQMVDFIRKSAKEKANGKGWIMLKDEDVYNYAIHYFDETNESLGLVTVKENKNTSTVISNAVKKVKNKTKLEKSENDVVVSTKKNKKKKEWIPEGQLSLFDLGVM